MLIIKRKNFSQRQAEGMKNSMVGKVPAEGSPDRHKYHVVPGIWQGRRFSAPAFPYS